jgi:phage terminase large subunit-like protein
VDIIANSEDQAKTSFDEVHEMLGLNWTKLKNHYYRSKTHIESLRTKSYIKYNTAGAKTKAGKRAACLVFDEIFAYQDYELINEFTASFGKKPHSRIFYITSDGNVREGVLDTEKKKAEDVLNGENDAIGYCPLIYCVESEDEVLDPDCWEKPNPSLPYSDNLRHQIEVDFAGIKYSSEKEESFYTKRMGWPRQARELLVATHQELITASGEIDVDLEGLQCVAGLDYALLSDMASVGLLFRVDDKRYWIQHSWICNQSADWGRIKAPLDEWQDRGDLTIVDGPQIDPFLIADWLTEQMTKYSIRTLAIDNARYALMREVLEQIGFNYDRKIGNVKLVRPLQIASVSPVIESWFRTGAIRWGDVPLMRWATNNTKKVRMRAESASGNYKYDKIEPRSRKTDPFMALVHAATVDEELQPATSSWVLDLPVITW